MQAPLLPVAPQQLLGNEFDEQPPLPRKWQTSPSGWQVFLHVGSLFGQLPGFAMLQVPICGCAGSGTHLTRPAPGRPLGASPPQQSESLPHRSPSTWQPDAGWQILLPPVPNGAQYDEQQPVQPSQVKPSTRHEVVMGAQVPAVAPDAMVQAPVQQSASWKQMSPSCVQYETCDGAAHVPPRQLALQHSPLPPQLLPAVLHVVLSGLHEPDTHCVLQQASPPAVHGWLSDTHWLALQVPLLQLRPQQSVELVQVEPVGMHADSAQRCMVGSQVPEQQSPLTAQAAPPRPQPVGPPRPRSSVPPAAAMSPVPVVLEEWLQPATSASARLRTTIRIGSLRIVLYRGNTLPVNRRENQHFGPRDRIPP
jgi:hypothetical protein